MNSVTVLATFMKLRNNRWGVRVPFAVNVNDLVTVKKLDGSTTTVEITKVVWTDGARAICEFQNTVAKSAPLVLVVSIPAPAPTALPAVVPTSAPILAPLTTLLPSTVTPAIQAHAKSQGACAKIDAAFSRDTFVAVACACCGRPLKDPNSIETSMGPQCRHEHGFDVQDEPAAWAQCFARLGANFPVDTYEQIVERHAHCIKRAKDIHGDSIKVAKDGQTQVDDSRDIKRAIKLLVHRISIADQAKTDGSTVLRCVLGIEALGYKRLARVLGRALVRRPALRELRGAASVFAISERENPETHVSELFVQSTYSERAITYYLRCASVPYRSVRGGYVVNSMHLTTVKSIATKLGADLVVDLDSITVNRDLTDRAPNYVAWVDDDASKPAQRTEWLDTTTDEWKRSALPGEPASRPEWERVPACYFATGTEVVARALTNGETQSNHAAE